MLTAFYQTYLLIVGVCALFCLLVNLYNFLYHVTLGKRERALRRRAEQLERLLPSEQVLEEKTRAQLMRRLRRGKNLRALYEAMEGLGWSDAEAIPEAAGQTLRHVLNGNLSVYKRRSDPQRALVVTIGNRLNLHTEQYQQFLTACMSGAPMYLRIVALRGCALQRSEALMLRAVDAVSGQGGAYGVKMITDVLTLYTGDRERFFAALWERFNRYSENMCCSILGVMTAERMESFAPQALDALRDETMYLECRIAAIKYFGAVVYAPAESVLAELLEATDWEYAAVSARALSNYACSGIGESLLRALASRNWHVRYNIAMTLASCRPDLVGRALEHEDRYARDIMQYALSISSGGAQV